VAEEGDDLVFVNPGDVKAVVEVYEFFEKAAVGLNSVWAIAHFLEFINEVVGASAVVWNVVGGDAGGFGFVGCFFFVLEVKMLGDGGGFDLEFNAFAEGGRPPFVFGVPPGVGNGFKGGCDYFVKAEQDA